MIKRLFLKVALGLANEFQKPLLYRRFLGVEIGTGARFTGTINFGSEPFLIKIGNHVTLAHNVTFHTHDGGAWVFRQVHPGLNLYGQVIIGNNVFVGSNVILLPNIRVGDNVVIGAGSVVTKSIPENVVVAGNPARIIRKLDEYEEKILTLGVVLDSSNTDVTRGEIMKAALCRR